MKKFYIYLLLGFLLASLFQVAFWLLQYNKVYEFPNINKFMSLSYTPYKGFNKNLKSSEEIQNDLIFLSNYTSKIRTYAMEDTIPLFPLISNTNLKIDIGIWISKDKEKNNKEILLAKYLIEKYPNNIETIIVGNESLLREEVTIDELINYIKIVKEFSPNHKITTAETWHNWSIIPQISEYCDLIYIHVLPYWESVPVNELLEYSKNRIDTLKDIYSNKEIVIGEFGFPSQGYNNNDSIASPKNQAYLIRNFVEYANKENLKYNIVDAFDQLWKGVHEGSVGSYWGIFDNNRNIKFQLNGYYSYNIYWKFQLLLALCIGFIYTYFGLKNQNLNFFHTLSYSLIAQAMSFGNVHALFYPYLNYMTFSMYIIWGIGTLMLIPLTLITLIKMNEILKCSIGVKPQRTIEKLKLNQNYKPFVSIHVPAYKENPIVLIETIKSLTQLDYFIQDNNGNYIPNYEIIVIINNTPEEEYKTKVKEFCNTFNHIKYLDITCTGFKAGAMNEALKYISKNTEVLAVIDADYVVKSNWLKDLCPIFENKNIAIVQAPQDHRDYNENLLKKSMNFEYAGFFDIGMIERNETNSIIVHGTMLLINYKAFIEVGGWNTDTIVEDTELGLRLFSKGYEMYYTNKRYGYGLLPDNIETFKTQRHRWVFGSVQIFKKHFNLFKFNNKTLTSSQKFNYLIGWSYWILEGLSSFITIINLIWIPFMIYFLFMIPTIPLMIPIIAAFIVNIFHSLILYQIRVKTSYKNTILSAITSMSLQFTIMKGLVEGFLGKKMTFKRTLKGNNILNNNNTSFFNKIPIKNEIILFICLNYFAYYFFTHNWMGIIDLYIFAIALIIQSIPYFSAIILHIIEILSIRNKNDKQ